MAVITTEQAKQRRQPRLTRRDILENNPSWSPLFVEDYEQKGLSLSSVEITVLDNSKQIAKNEAEIAANAQKISANSQLITANTVSITQNTVAISSVNANLDAHKSGLSAHGVTGDNVGTEDYAQALIGGVVLLADLVNDASQTSTAIATADVGAAPAAYSQAYAQQQTDLINECKAKINALVTDAGDVITQLNDLIAKMKTAKQMSTT